MAIKSKRIYTSAIFALLISCVVPSAMAIPVSVTSNYIAVITSDENGSPSGDGSSFTGTSIPVNQTLTASAGNSHNTTNINYSGDASSAIFSVDMSSSIDNTNGTGFDYALTYEHTLVLTADANTTFSISGFNDMTGLAAIYMDVTFYDLTDNAQLFRENEFSLATTDELFSLNGVADGDNFNNISGSLTGNLIAGHDYRFYFSSYIQDYMNDYDGSGGYVRNIAAIAESNVTLSIGTSASVSEPPLLALLSIGLVGIGFTRRKV